MPADPITRANGLAGHGGGIALILLALVVTADVVARAAGFALVGAAEAGGILLAMLVFLALGHTQALRGHVAIEVLVTMFPPRLRRLADVISLLVCLGIGIVLTDSTARGAWDSYADQEFQFGTIQFPLWPIKAIVALGLGLLSLQFAVQAWHSLLVLAGRRPEDGLGDDFPQATV